MFGGGRLGLRANADRHSSIRVRREWRAPKVAVATAFPDLNLPCLQGIHSELTENVNEKSSLSRSESERRCGQPSTATVEDSKLN